MSAFENPLAMFVVSAPLFAVFGNDLIMTSIARGVEVFNQAYRLAWPHVSENKIQRTDVSKLLGDAIQRRIRVGETDLVKIATGAVTEMQQRYRDNLAS